MSTPKNDQPWIVIPARGGSTGVPRKNVRLLGGEPLIARAIKTALASTLADRVVVITDDDEIAEISEYYGARVVREPKTTGKATLDEVMVRTIANLKGFGASDSEVLLTMQPTCPFITPARVTEAMQKFAAGAGSVITVIDDRHLGWRLDASGNPEPDYTARVNRQMLPAQYRESGAIIGARIGDVLANGTRIVHPINLVEVPEGEALDIDTFADWAVAEHLVSRRKIVLRTDAAKELGMGHVYRVLALAYALARHDLTIVVSADKPLGAAFFCDYPFKVGAIAGEAEFVQYVAESGADAVVLDLLDTDAEFVEALRKTSKVVTFEDLGSGAEVADLLVSDLYENPRVPAERQLSGVQHAILAPSFESIPRQSSPNESVESLLLLFGGTDPSGLVFKSLDALRQIGFSGEVIVVRGLGAEPVDASAWPELNLNVLHNVLNMPALMAKADLAISSAGRTITELSVIGVPTLCIAQNAKELTHTHTTTGNGVVMLGLGTEISVETLSSELEALIADGGKRAQLRANALAATAGRSNEHIVREIMHRLDL